MALLKLVCWAIILTTRPTFFTWFSDCNRTWNNVPVIKQSSVRFLGLLKYLPQSTSLLYPRPRLRGRLCRHSLRGVVEGLVEDVVRDSAEESFGGSLEKERRNLVKDLEDVQLKSTKRKGNYASDMMKKLTSE